MAHVRGTRATIEGSSTRQRNPVVEVIVPSFFWTEDSNGHYLTVDLPDFTKQQVKIQVTTSGHIKVYGERPVNENRRIRFEQTYKVPENSNMDTITAKFDGEILYITVPKYIVEKNREEPETTEKKNGEVINGAAEENINKKLESDGALKKKDDDDVRSNEQVRQSKEKEGSHRNAPMNFSEENIRRWERESGYLRSAMDILSKNRAIVVTAVLAFSLGMLISRKFESSGE